MPAPGSSMEPHALNTAKKYKVAMHLCTRSTAISAGQRGSQQRGFGQSPSRSTTVTCCSFARTRRIKCRKSTSRGHWTCQPAGTGHCSSGGNCHCCCCGGDRMQCCTTAVPEEMLGAVLLESEKYSSKEWYNRKQVCCWWPCACRDDIAHALVQMRNVEEPSIPDLPCGTKGKTPGANLLIRSYFMRVVTHITHVLSTEETSMRS